ncbi:hypothetical protein HanPI659440_Chr06g0224381 [Helianthus annuus]|nr:hypothetical protein HanPI659440_Chr06g0224381 [Helianthus annuus]
MDRERVGSQVVKRGAGGDGTSTLHAKATTFLSQRAFLRAHPYNLFLIHL